MTYLEFFEKAVSSLKAEKRYRIFADLERQAGKFPRAIWRADNGL
jgi:5-aminolevulinate synthase